MLKALRTDIQKRGVGKRKDVSFHFGRKILQHFQILLSMALSWLISVLGFHQDFSEGGEIIRYFRTYFKIHWAEYCKVLKSERVENV